MKRRNYLIFFVISIIVFAACNKEEFETSSNARLAFSLDTVMFDTVFTDVGSTTKRLKVYNNHNKILNISSIDLAGGNSSNFRLNIDGYELNSISDIDILPKDSMYIFVEVTVDPNEQNSPLMIHDSIVFITNGNIQDVDLVAFGQNVHKKNKEIIGTQTWVNDKPYLIYNYLAVDSLETLTIEAGVKIHFHQGAILYVAGTIIVNGTVEEPVIFQGDRLEEAYDDVPGQWGLIVLAAGSYNNRIDHAIIKNAVAGIQVGEYDSEVASDLFISNTRIENMTSYGLYLFNSSVFAANCLIANCGYYGAFMAVSGYHRFYHCTFANYFDYANRIDPTILISNNIIVYDVEYIGNMDAYFGNSIIYGSNLEEIEVSDDSQGEMIYKFENCLTRIRTDNNATYEFDLSDTSHFVNIINNEDPGFKDIIEYNYELDTLSVAKDAGSRSITDKYDFLEFDILGQSRISDSNPDLGAYERIEE